MYKIKTKMFKLGCYIVQPAHNKILLDDEEYKIEPKIMQVLCYLVENEQTVCSRAQIANALWPESVTGLEVVTRAIFELRKTLKDDSKNPKYIETIARKGYCFIYEPETFPSLKENSQLTQCFIKYHVLLKLIFTVLALILILVSLNLVKPNSIETKQLILTDTNVYADMPALSPDRNKLLYIQKKHFSDTLSELVLLDLTSHKKTNITQANAEYKSPIWLKNSESWYYVRCQQASLCEIIKHDIDEQKIDVLLTLNNKVFSMVMSHNRKLLAITVVKDNNMQIALIDLMNIEKPLSLINAPQEHNSHPVFSDDDKSIYFISTIRGGASQIYRHDIIENNYLQISTHFSRIGGLALKDERSLWVTGNTKEAMGVWDFNVSTKTATLVQESFKGHIPSLISSHVNSEKLVYKNATRTINIGATGINNKEELTNINSSMVDMNGVYSTKLKALYFSSNRSGSFELWRLRNNTIDKLTSINANMIERPILNQQQDKLAFLTRANSHTQLSVLDLTNLDIQKQHVLPKKSFLLSWSNDQKNIYFSVYENNQYNIYQLNSEKNEKRKILLNAGLIAQESEDGTSIIYGDMINRQIMQKHLSGEINILFKQPENEQGLAPHQIKMINNKLYYVALQNNKLVLKYYDMEKSKSFNYVDLPDNAFITDIVDTDTIAVVYDKVISRNANLIALSKK